MDPAKCSSIVIIAPFLQVDIPRNEIFLNLCKFFPTVPLLLVATFYEWICLEKKYAKNFLKFFLIAQFLLIAPFLGGYASKLNVLELSQLAQHILIAPFASRYAWKRNALQCLQVIPENEMFLHFCK